MANNNRLFVGGLPYGIDDNRLSELFSKCGNVISSKVIMDKMTNRSKGFGFVEYQTEEEANNAIKEFNDMEIEGRKIAVNIAKPLEERKPFNDRPFERRSYGNQRGGNRGGGGNRRGGNRW